MAYGKIKADAIIYDNSGSDVEKTVVSLTTPEGTAVKSTGESGTTKFLRVDGDGTCSWQVPPDTNTQLTLVDEDNMSSNSNTSVPSQQSVKAYVDGKVPTSITVADESSDTTCFPLFVTAATGDLAPKSGSNITFNSSTGLLTAVGLTLSGDLTVNGTTTTIDSSTLTVEDKNIELGKVSSPSDTTADGGGITLKGATDKTITWVDATDCWTFNQNVEVTSGFLKVLGTEGGAASFYLYADEGDDAADKWRLQTTTGGAFKIENYSNGSSWATGLSFDGSNNVTFGGSVTDSKGNVRSIPSNAQGGAYVGVAADAGKAIYISTGGVTINNSVFSAGDAVTIINNSGSDQTITQGSGVTIHNTADAATGNRTLAGRGMATIWFASASVAYISGAGLS